MRVQKIKLRWEKEEWAKGVEWDYTARYKGMLVLIEEYRGGYTPSIDGEDFTILRYVADVDENQIYTTRREASAWCYEMLRRMT